MKQGHAEKRRLLAMAAAAIALFAGAAMRLGTGSFSAFGWDAVYAVCPLGWLEAALAGQDMMLHLALPFLALLLLAMLVGRVFCGWVCPVPLTRKIMANRLDDAPAPEERPSIRGPLAALALALGSAAAFGFPVFCLICPIGLAVGTMLMLIRLVGVNDPSWDIVLFPLLLAAELLLLRRWCSRFCPVGALLGLFSRFHRAWLPAVDKGRCIEGQGGACGRCHGSCPFSLDPRQAGRAETAMLCTKCRACAEHCPQQAIRFPFRLPWS